MHRIPPRSNNPKPDQHDTSIIHTHRRDGQRSRHTKQHQLKRNPSQRHAIHDRSQHASQIPARFEDLLALVEQADGDGDGVRQREGLHAHADEGGESAAAAQVDEAEEELDGGYEGEGVEGDVQGGVDFGPGGGWGVSRSLGWGRGLFSWNG